MKAFMTLCAFLAGSASAESQHILNRISFDQLTGSPLMTTMPSYMSSMYTSPVQQVSYANAYNYQLGGSPLISYPVAQLIKREAEAEPDSPYVYKTEVVNPEDGSEYKSEVQVDRNGNGRSYQRVEQKEGLQRMRDSYHLMDQMNRVNQMRMNQMNRDQMRMDQRQMDQMRYNGHQMIDNRQMDQNQMDHMRMNQMNRDQMRMDQMRMDQRQRDQMRMDQMRMDQRQRDQMRMNQMDRGQMIVQRPMDQMDQQQMDQRRQPELRQMNSPQRRLSMNNQMDMNINTGMDMDMNNQMNMNMPINQGPMNRGVAENRQQMNRDNLMNMNNQMKMGYRRMMKRETSPAFAYTIMTEHPSEMSRNMMDRMSSPYMMRPSYYLGRYMVRPVGSNVAVFQNGRTYGFRTMA